VWRKSAPLKYWSPGGAACCRSISRPCREII
jgi:hypothetical protein